MPNDDRPREKLAKRGPRSLTDAELIAIFLRVGVQGTNAVEMGQSLIERHGSLGGLARCSVTELAKTRGVGLAKAAQLAAAFELGARFALETVSSRPVDSPEAIEALLGAEMRALRQESVRVVLLDTKKSLIVVEEITRGSIDESLAPPREILRAAIVHSAHSFILVHNHPSGNPMPSGADRSLTRRIDRAAKEVGIDFLDHIILGAPMEDSDQAYFSFREMGMV